MDLTAEQMVYQPGYLTTLLLDTHGQENNYDQFTNVRELANAFLLPTVTVAGIAPKDLHASELSFLPYYSTLAFRSIPYVRT